MFNPMMGPLGASMDNPLAQALGKLQANTLGGGGVTLGNEQAQQDYTQQMAQALAQMQSAASQQSLGESMMAPEYVQNSGLLGSLAMMAQAAAGKKMTGRAAKDDAAAREAYYKGEAAAKAEQEARDAQRKLEEAAAERKQREADAERYGLQGRDRMRYALEGKVGEGVRGVPMMTDQGLVNVNPYTGEYAAVAPQGAQGGPRIDPSLPPEVRAAIAQHESNGTPLPDELNVVGRAQGAPLRPYRDPAEAQRQAASDARAEAQLGLSMRADERAQAAAERDAAKANREASSRNNVLDQWMAAREGLESGLAGSETGPLVGRLPAFTTEQQIAEGAVSATAPILKQIFRSAGEGTFTDKDQELLLRMVPTRTDTPEARSAKIANIDRIIRAKVGVQQPASGGINDLLKKYGGK